MGAVWLVSEGLLRRRWRSLIVLALVIGIVGAVTLSAAAGARRTASSLDRFTRSSRSADIELAVADPTAAQLRRLADAPGVAAVAVLRAYGFVLSRGPNLEEGGAIVDHRFGSTIDRPRIVAGRAPNPAAPAEVAIGEALASQLHVGVGASVTVGSYTPEQIAATLGGTPDVGAPAGPRIHLHVVGIERRVSDLGESAVSGGLLVFTPAFDRAYAGRVGVFGSYIRVRTHDGPEEAAPIVAGARRIFGETLFSSRIASETGGAQSAIDVLTLALWIFVGVVALAGTLTVAIVLGREVTLLTREHDALRSLGATRTERLAVCVPSALVVAAGGALLAVLGAVAASPLFPLGVARRADPDVGVHVDIGVLAVGVAAIFLVALGITFAAAWRATRPAARLRSVDRRPSRATLAERAAGVGFRPPVANGVRMALDRGRGRVRVPVRSAIVGAVVGILGVTAVLLFAVNVDQLVHSPSRYGWTWDFETRDTTSNTPCGAGTYGLRRTEGVSAVAEVCYQGIQVDGRPVEGLAFRDLRGTPIGPVVLAGRAPSGRATSCSGAAPCARSGGRSATRCG